MLDWLFKPAVDNTIGKVLDLVDETFETDQEKSEFKAKLLDRVGQSDANQSAVNKVEAGHRSVFVAGWRPAVGWVCVFALALRFVATPLLSPWVDIPQIEWEELSVVLMGMLGLGTLRTIEKAKGLTR